jgi:fluoroacetyl-CoA thioesterase
MALVPGLRAAFDHTVADQDTAVALGSGDVPVLGTPRVLALAERATVAAAIGPGATTVGARVELEHLAASVVGAAVRVSAELERVDGRVLEFAVELRDGARPVARGRVTRVLVDRDAFLATAAR